MGRSPSTYEENGLKKGPWTPEEDEKLREYISEHGIGSWRALPRLVGLNRCGKSCRLRWMNYLRPEIKRGSFSEEEERLIIHLHSIIGNRWSKMATQLPGRTDNEIKNFWNTHLKKKLLRKGIDPTTHKPIPPDHIPITNDLLASLIIAQSLRGPSNNNSLGSSVGNPWELVATELAKLQLAHNLIQFIGTNTPTVDLYGAYNTLSGPHSSKAKADSQNIVPGMNLATDHLHTAANSWPWASSVSENYAKLPAIWPGSSSKESTEDTPASSCFSTKSNASMNVFEDLGKLMEDDTCASFLEEFLRE